MSQGLGLGYLTPKKKKFFKELKNPYLTLEEGKKIPIPRYFKQKIFTEQETKIVNQKAKQFITQTDQFKSEKHRLDYVANQIKTRDKIARQTRKL